MPLPEWLIETPVSPPGSAKGRRNWLSHAINRLLRLTMPDRHRSSLLHLDPRAAVVGFVGLVVCCTFLGSPSGLALSWAIACILSVVVGANPRTLAVSWVVVGLVTGAMMLPGATSAVTPGAPVGSVLGVTFTLPGAHVLLMVELRTLACLTLGIGLFSSNRAEELFCSLRWFRLPSVFVMILLMTYRYLQVVARAALESHIARKSRIARESSLSDARHWLGEQSGALFVRSRKLGEDVHQAMIARGFDGEWLPGPRSQFRWQDVWWILVCAAAIVVLVYLDRSVLV